MSIEKKSREIIIRIVSIIFMSLGILTGLGIVDRTGNFVYVIISLVSLAGVFVGSIKLHELAMKNTVE